MNIFGFKKKKEYSSKEILAQLDKCANDYTFPMLDNGYIYPIHSKLTAYRDEKRWALIIEVFGFNYRGGGHNGISNCMHIFGNCISTNPGTDNANFLQITNDTPDSLTFDEEYQESLNPQAKRMTLRGMEIDINHDREFYLNKGIELEEENKIFVWEFMRGLEPEYNNKFEATEKEIRERIPEDLPLILTLKEWNHPDCAGAELPSSNETFIQIAKVLETGKIEYYNPTLKPNNHWKNWPEGGKL
ncbi:hypothetical protein H7U19_16750 [Hyunsoonleella sp. SJ7]|uniref:Uncharacterized protein n=1 Tax=Hyunsoonleella aquatilis TaxID=2762758 RepID=A0A923KJD7_9FLAO|nr:hypothetical protein [Hyunsoonleella aquatilis]MBC3760059.1 hypothetical protein [Hyunsoonleella aquatilis]